MTAPFGRRHVPVVQNERLGEYFLLTLLDEYGPRGPLAGQFYMLAASERWGGGSGERPYLPRAFSFCRAHPDGRLDFLIEAIGPGTERLAELSAGDVVWLTGPLGNGFDLDFEGRAILVGGGIGVAPLVALEQDVGDAEILLGFRSRDHAAAAELFRGPVSIATDDGSAGRQALVTDLLRERLDDAISIYACGPPPMLEAVRALAEKRALPAALAMEAGMACGYGACFGCVHPTRSGYVRLCVDGPVLEAAELDTALTVALEAASYATAG